MIQLNSRMNPRTCYRRSCKLLRTVNQKKSLWWVIPILWEQRHTTLSSLQGGQTISEIYSFQAASNRAAFLFHIMARQDPWCLPKTMSLNTVTGESRSSSDNIKSFFRKVYPVIA